MILEQPVIREPMLAWYCFKVSTLGNLMRRGEKTRDKKVISMSITVLEFLNVMGVWWNSTRLGQTLCPPVKRGDDWSSCRSSEQILTRTSSFVFYHLIKKQWVDLGMDVVVRWWGWRLVTRARRGDGYLSGYPSPESFLLYPYPTRLSTIISRSFTLFYLIHTLIQYS